MLGIPNFWNVVSNIGFILVGLRGLVRLHDIRTPGVLPELRRVYHVLFAALGLSALPWAIGNRRILRQDRNSPVAR